MNWNEKKPRFSRPSITAMLSLLLLCMSVWSGCATKPSAAVSSSPCYTGSLSAAGVHALLALDPIGYANVAAGDLFITPSCAMAQIQGLTDEIRALESP